MEENKEVVATKEEKTENPVDKGGKPNGDNRPRRFNGPRRDLRKKPSERADYKERLVYVNRISKTVQGGRHMRFSAIAVVGYSNSGEYGFAIEKASEVPDAAKKAVKAAKKNVYKIDIIDPKNRRTISHEVMGKFGATQVYLKPAPAGTGIIAGGPVRAILELAGLKNVVSKVYGARSSINVIRATHNALQQLKSVAKVQELRGINKEEK